MEASRATRVLHEGIEILELSGRTGAGIDQWVAWLERQWKHARQHWDGVGHLHDHRPATGQGEDHHHARRGPEGV